MYYFNFIYIFLLVFTANSCSKGYQQPVPEQVQETKTDSTSLDFIYAKKELEGKLSAEFTVSAESYFLIASNLSESETEKIVNNTILKAVSCFYNDYFQKKTDDITTSSTNLMIKLCL
jgi:hypothetical protein